MVGRENFFQSVPIFLLSIDMKIYNVTDISKNGDFYLIAVIGSGGIIKHIELPRKCAESLLVGQTITALESKFYYFEDYVYLYGDTMYMNTKLPVADEYFCKQYIENLIETPDRTVFEQALRCECKRHDIVVDKEAWVNLHNLVLWGWFGRFVNWQR